MKRLLLGLLVGAVLGAGSLYVFECWEHRQELKDAAAAERLEASVVDAFRFTLEDEVKKKLGSPVEGFEPQMFLDVFPGLAMTDFDGVEASAGTYEVENGALVFVPDATKLQHSASGSIGKQGISTLLNNIAKRAKIDLSGAGTLTDIMRVLTAA